MTEHAAVIFVFFFLAEYSSIVLICILTSVLFLGGYLYDVLPFSLFSIFQFVDFDYYIEETLHSKVLGSENFSPLTEGLFYGLSLGLKSCLMTFVFI
jgi:NADH-ubiquinone oxidoreductase chain 1